MFIQRRKIEHVLDEFQRGNLSNSKGVYESKYISPTIRVFNTTSHLLRQGDFAYITGMSSVGSALDMAQEWTNGSMVFDVCDEDHTAFSKPDSLEGGLILAKDGYYKNDSDNASIVIIAEDIDPAESGQAYADNLYATFAVCWEREIDECMPKNCYTNKPLFVEQYNIDSRWSVNYDESRGYPEAIEDPSDISTIYQSSNSPNVIQWHESIENTHYARFCLNGEYVVAMSEYDEFPFDDAPRDELLLQASDRKIVFVVCKQKKHTIKRIDRFIKYGLMPVGHASYDVNSKCEQFMAPYLTQESKDFVCVYQTLAVNHDGQSYILPFTMVYERMLPDITYNIDGNVIDSLSGEFITDKTYQYKVGYGDNFYDGPKVRRSVLIGSDDLNFTNQYLTTEFNNNEYLDQNVQVCTWSFDYHDRLEYYQKVSTPWIKGIRNILPDYREVPLYQLSETLYHAGSTGFDDRYGYTDTPISSSPIDEHIVALIDVNYIGEAPYFSYVKLIDVVSPKFPCGITQSELTAGGTCSVEVGTDTLDNVQCFLLNSDDTIPAYSKVVCVWRMSPAEDFFGWEIISMRCSQ